MSERQKRLKLTSSQELELFARSGGYCQNPICATNLFISSQFNIAERAHIIAHSPGGPRGDTNLPTKEIQSVDNYLLLCPNCHTMVDKDPVMYPASLLRKWRNDCVILLEKARGIRIASNRQEARDYVSTLLLDNKVFFETRGPMNIESFNPESRNAEIWKNGVKEKIIPNNRNLILFIEKNYNLLTENERINYSKFKLHAEELELKHIFKKRINHTQFPTDFSTIYSSL